MEGSRIHRRTFLVGAGVAAAAALYAGRRFFSDTVADFFNISDEQFVDKFVRVLSPSEVEAKKKKTLGNTHRSREASSSLDLEEVEDLIWNIVNESAVGETEEGMMGILLCTIDRMMHPNNPPTATGVIYKLGQFSWVDHARAIPMPSRENNKDKEKERVENFKKNKSKHLITCRNFFRRITNGGKLTVGEVRQNIRQSLLSKGVILPETPLLFYKRHDWDHNDPKSKNYRKMSKRTVRTFKILEARMKQRGESVVRLGNHNFYSAKGF